MNTLLRFYIVFELHWFLLKNMNNIYFEMFLSHQQTMLSFNFGDFSFLFPKNVEISVGTIRRSYEIKMCPYNKKRLRIKNVKFITILGRWDNTQNSIFKKSFFFHDFLVFQKSKNFFTIRTKLKNNYPKSLNSNFVNEICVIFKYLKGLKKNWRVACALRTYWWRNVNSSTNRLIFDYWTVSFNQ